MKLNGKVEISELEKQIEIMVREKFKRHLCVIRYSGYIGTGNLFRHADQSFILTCEHVASEACDAPDLEIVFPNNVVMGKKNIFLFRKDRKSDLALIRIDSDVQSTDLTPISFGDFAFGDDLRTFIDDKSVFLVVGFPKQITKIIKSSDRIRVQPLFYRTVLSDDKPTTKAKVYLDYPSGKDEMPGLPEAYGLSGAGIWHMPPIKDEIWSPIKWKLVAIQYAWKEGEYIVGSGVQKVFDWLNK